MSASARLVLAMVSMAARMAAGCADEDEQACESPTGTAPEPLPSPGAAVFFSSYTYASTNGVAAVERFAECGPDEVMSGFGGKVGGDDVLSVTTYCRAILPSGALSVDERAHVDGCGEEELALHAAADQVVVGLGGTISDDSFEQLLLRVCSWSPTTRSIDLARCELRSSSGMAAASRLHDTHANYSAEQKPKVIAAGAGMTCTGDKVYAIRMTVGLLN